MPFVRLRSGLRALPLRFKLTLWNTLVMLAASVVTLVALREGLRWMLLKELHVALEDEAFELALLARQQYATTQDLFDELARTSAGHARHGWFLQVVAPDGHSLWQSPNTPAALQHGPRSPLLRVRGDEAAAFHFAERSIHSRLLPECRLRVGTSLEFIQQDVANVTRMFVPVLLGVILLSPLGGYILAGRATAPLQQVIATTRTLHPARLEERLVLRHTGDELDQLSAEINKFLDQIADHLQRHREFVANAAHELRSPLSALTTLVDVALSRERSPAEYQELLATVHDECQQLATLTSQLLLLAESDAGLLERHKQPVLLDEVVLSAVEMFSGVAEVKDVQLASRCEPRVCVMAETTRLRQVVNNLLDNAIKFTPAGGKVEVELRRNSAKHVLLTVRDTGVGIPADALPYVFDRFYQVERSRHHETVVHGTGLGLSICRAVVAAYGGDVAISSQPGVGTTVTVTLPAAGG
jgi:signal transduction histidine kinase